MKKIIVQKCNTLTIIFFIAALFLLLIPNVFKDYLILSLNDFIK